MGKVRGIESSIVKFELSVILKDPQTFTFKKTANPEYRG